MRSMTMALLVVSVLAASCGFWCPTAAGEEPDQGPIMLELNAPLLAQPLESELPELTATERQNKASKEQVAEKTASKDEQASQSENATEEDSSDENAELIKPAAKTPPPLPKLSAEMQSLRKAVRQTLATYFTQPLNTRDNTPTNVLQACLAYGCNTEVRQGGPAGQRLNGFTCLCWNYPCEGYRLLRVCDDDIVAGVGYGLQEYPGQFLATMALARVPAEYPLQTSEGNAGKVSDLVEYEKKSCRDGEEPSFKLIGLSRYVPSGQTWKNDLGETWSIERLLKQDLDRTADTAPDGGTYRLLAMSYAIDRRLKNDKPIDGQYQRARTYLADYANYTLDLQNPDGSWHPEFFAKRGNAGTRVDQIRSTGHILRWLAFALPEKKLQDPQMVRGMTFLVNSLADNRRYSGYLATTSSREIAARYAALHALSLYHQREFAPYDAQEKAQREQEEAAKKAKDEVAAKTAGRS